MAEINNSLALGVKPAEFDIMKPLAGAAQINSLRANTAKTQQDIDYNQRLQDQGQNGMRPQEENTLAEANTKQAELRGRAANEIVQDPSDAGVQSAFKHFEQAGAPLPPKVQQEMLAMPPEQRRQRALQIQQGSMPSSTSNLQNPKLIAERAQAETGGTTLGGMYGPTGGPPANGAGPPPPGGPMGAPGGSPAAGPPSGPQNLSLMERKAEAQQNAEGRAQEFKGYQTENDAANTEKVALQQIKIDADRVRTGKGETKINEARKWIQTASQFIPGLDQYAAKFNDPVAAFESIEKNKGIIARAAMKGVGGTAASELDTITHTLVSGETSHKGIDINASQLIGFKNFQKARFQAAQSYQDQYGSLKGFAADFNNKAGPAAWVYMSLPEEEQKSIAETLKKSKQGQTVLNSIAKQINHIHKNKLDESVD